MECQVEKFSGTIRVELRGRQSFPSWPGCLHRDVDLVGTALRVRVLARRLVARNQQEMDHLRKDMECHVCDMGLRFRTWALSPRA